MTGDSIVKCPSSTNTADSISSDRSDVNREYSQKSFLENKNILTECITGNKNILIFGFFIFFLFCVKNTSTIFFHNLNYSTIGTFRGWI